MGANALLLPPPKGFKFLDAESGRDELSLTPRPPIPRGLKHPTRPGDIPFINNAVNAGPSPLDSIKRNSSPIRLLSIACKRRSTFCSSSSILGESKPVGEVDETQSEGRRCLVEHCSDGILGDSICPASVRPRALQSSKNSRQEIDHASEADELQGDGAIFHATNLLQSLRIHAV